MCAWACSSAPLVEHAQLFPHEVSQTRQQCYVHGIFSCWIISWGVFYQTSTLRQSNACENTTTSTSLALSFTLSHLAKNEKNRFRPKKPDFYFEIGAHFSGPSLSRCTSPTSNSKPIKSIATSGQVCGLFELNLQNRLPGHPNSVNLH